MPTRVTRRRLLTAAASAVPAAALAGQGRRGTAAPRTAEPWSVQDLERRYRRELFDELLPFWDRHGLDRELGGVMCALDYDGTRVSTDKTLRFHARGIWTYSHLYNAFGREARWLDVARQLVAFSMRHLRQPDGSWAQVVSREGAVIQPSRPNETTGLLDLSEGLQEFAAASGDDSMRALARDLFIRAMRDGDAASRPTRRQGFWFMTVLSATQMLKRRADPDIDRAAQRAVTAVLDHHYNSDTRLNDEVVEGDLSRSKADAGFTVFGHSIEALWMVLDEVARRGDAAGIDRCAERIHRHLEAGWDRVYGGLCHAVRVDAGAYEWPVERPLGTTQEFRFVGEYHYMKASWPLWDAIIATLKVLEHRPSASWAREYLRLAQDTLDARFSRRPHGSPVYVLFADRRITHPPHASRQDNYHHPRMLMLALESLRRMREAGRSTV